MWKIVSFVSIIWYNSLSKQRAACENLKILILLLLFQEFEARSYKIVLVKKSICVNRPTKLEAAMSVGASLVKSNPSDQVWSLVYQIVPPRPWIHENYIWPPFQKEKLPTENKFPQNWAKKVLWSKISPLGYFGILVWILILLFISRQLLK